MVVLNVVLETPDAGSVVLCKIRSRRLIVDAAQEALSEAAELAKRMADEDKTLGLLHEDELNRLRRALQLTIPELLPPGVVQ